MKNITQEEKIFQESFKDLFEKSVKSKAEFIGHVVKGRVIRIDGDSAVVDVGLKSEGRVPLREFGDNAKIESGQDVEVYIDKYEDMAGQIVLSREKAHREELWVALEKQCAEGIPVIGTPQRRVKGGFSVDIGGIMAFLPGSQLDIRPMRNVNSILNVTQPLQILKMERKRSNIVVSRKAILEKTAGAEAIAMIDTTEGAIIEGTVKNITNYGAFIDLGGVDGLLHVTDISWSRINHPSEVLQVGQAIKVKVIKINSENGRISLGMKQMLDDPWSSITEKYIVSQKYIGKITNITDYGSFVELEPGIEGLVHVSEMSWTRKNIHPNKLVTINQPVEVMVMDVEVDKRRISLGMKQCIENPWEVFAKSHKVGEEISGEIHGVTDFGLFIGLSGGIDGMIRTADLSWQEITPSLLQTFKKGDTVTAKIIDIDAEKERVALSIKHLTADPFAEKIEGIKKGETVKATVVDSTDDGISVEVNGLSGFIRKNDIARELAEQNTKKFAKGDVVEAVVIQIDKNTRNVNLSIKAVEIAEHKKALSNYAPDDSGGTSLGHLLNQAMKDKKGE